MLELLLITSVNPKMIFDLLVKYSRINIYLFIITTIALFTSINTFSIEGVDTSKVLPFQGMINSEPWRELLTNPYWWYFEATVVSLNHALKDNFYIDYLY